MDIHIHLERKHAFIFALFTTLLLGGLFAVAFGGNDPTVVGHSAGELIINSSSIVDNSVTATDIDESTLAGAPCTTITGGAGLCDGGDATGLTTVDQSAFNTCSPATTCSVSCSSGTMVGCGCEPSTAIAIVDHHITGNTCTCGIASSGTINVRGICIS